MEANNALDVVATRYAYPLECVCCGSTIESADDLEWHGLGNCVDLCDCMFTAQADGAGDPNDCPLCRGEGSVDVARRKGMVR